MFSALNDYKKRHIISVAAKDQKSFFIASSKSDFQLIDDNQTKYKASEQFTDQTLDVAYDSHQDAYFLNIGGQLYRKDCDAKPPYKYLDFPLNPESGCRSLRYSKKLKRLFCSDTHTIYVVNTRNKRVEHNLRIKFRRDNYWGENKISDFLILESQTPIIVVLDYNDSLFMDKIQGTSFLKQVWKKVFHSKPNFRKSHTVDPKETYLIAGGSVFFRIVRDSLEVEKIPESSGDWGDKDIGSFSPPCFYKYASEEEMIFILPLIREEVEHPFSVPRYMSYYFGMLSFNSRTNQVKRYKTWKDIRKDSGFWAYVWYYTFLHNIGGQLYFVGLDAKVSRLEIELKYSVSI